MDKFEFWLIKDPADLDDKKLIEAMKFAWVVCKRSEDYAGAHHGLLAELERRNADKAAKTALNQFRASMVIAVAALIVSLVQIFWGR